MANKIQIKRSTANATVTGLSNGELAFTQASNTLHIGLPDGSGVLRIGGAQYPGTLTNNHALVANATGGIDKVITANLVPTQITANGSLGTLNYVLVSGGSSGNVRWVHVSDVGGVNTDAQYTFSNTITFNGIINTTNVYSTGAVNAAVHSVGTNFIANTTRVTVGPGVGFSANGTLGTANQVLRSNGSSIYWSDDVGDISSITAGNGLAGGGTTGDITLSVQAGNSQIVSNSSGIFLNAVSSSQITGDIALGTQTSGNYVATITAGSGISGSGTGEGSTPTIAVVANNGIVSNSSGVFAKSANGISVYASGINVLGGSTLTVNSSGAHVNSTLSLTDLTLAGNLTINGTLTTIDTQNLTVNDSIIAIARNNGGNSLDIGWFGQYNDGSNRYTGFIWDHTNNVYELFANTTAAPTTTLNTSGTGYARAVLRAFLNTGALVANATNVNITANSTVAVGIVANTLTLSSPLAGTSGGTGWATVTSQDLLVGNTSNGWNKLALGTAGYVLQSNGSALVYDVLDGGVF